MGRCRYTPEQILAIRKYTPEQVQWIRDNCRGLFYPEALILFNNQFGLNITLSKFKGICTKYKVKLGTAGKKCHGKGVPIGTITRHITKSGYEVCKIKTGEGKHKGNWQFLSSFLGLKELKKAAKAMLKETDEKLYIKRYRPCGKKYKIDDAKLIEKLLEGGTVHD